MIRTSEAIDDPLCRIGCFSEGNNYLLRRRWLYVRFKIIGLQCLHKDLAQTRQRIEKFFSLGREIMA